MFALKILAYPTCYDEDLLGMSCIYKTTYLTHNSLSYKIWKKCNPNHLSLSCILTYFFIPSLYEATAFSIIFPGKTLDGYRICNKLTPSFLSLFFTRDTIMLVYVVKKLMTLRYFQEVTSYVSDPEHRS